MPRHRVSPSASPMTGSCGASSTPRPLDRSQALLITGLPAFAGNDGNVMASRLLGEFRRRLAGDLPEGVGKRRHAGIAEIGSQLLDRNIGVGRELFDCGGNPGALAPALEAQLRL